MIETLITVLVICMLFFGLLQLSQVFAAKEVLQHAATRSARARTVGFDHWMCDKAMLVASIPNAGKMKTPVLAEQGTGLQKLLEDKTPGAVWDASLQTFPASQQSRLEKSRIPDFIASGNASRGLSLLNYEEWENIRIEGLDQLSVAEKLEVNIKQDFPLFISLSNWLFAPVTREKAETIKLTGHTEIEKHYSLYLEEMNW